VPSLAAYPSMMQRDRKREGLRICRAAWLIGVTVSEYREIEAGDRVPDNDAWDRLCKLYGWPQTFVGSARG
jgi:Helix-turn-helix domain